MDSVTGTGGGMLAVWQKHRGAIRAALLAAVGVALTWAFVWNVPDVRGSVYPKYPYTQDLPPEVTDPARGAPVAADGRWERDGEAWYFLGADGVAQTGWAKDGDYWYYLRPAVDMPNAGPKGSMVVGWAEIDGCRYYFDPDGAMHVGRLAYDGFEYYMADGRELSRRSTFPYGSMVTGFVEGAFIHYYVEEPCLQLFLWGEYPEGAFVTTCAFVDWSGSVRHASSGVINESGTLYYDVVL